MYNGDRNVTPCHGERDNQQHLLDFYSVSGWHANTLWNYDRSDNDNACQQCSFEKFAM